jgi:multidrug resistance efflux pump
MVAGNVQKQGVAEAETTAAALGAGAAKNKRSGLGALIKSPLVLGALVVVVAIGLFFGVRYIQDMESKVSIDTAEISAPVISIGPETPGTLKVVYVKEGDRVTVGQQLFSVGDHVTSARTDGVITSVQNTPGQYASQQSVIVQMYDPASLRIIGHIQEDQGLSDVKIGQKVAFTVDAFPSQTYAGTVEFIAKTADQANLAFSISDKRQERQFQIKAAFDPKAYPELQNGMSAKMSVYK